MGTRACALAFACSSGQHTDLLRLAVLAVVLIIANQHLALDIQVQRLLDSALPLHVQAQHQAVLQPLALVLALLADDLVADLPPEHVFDQVLLRQRLQQVLHLVHEVHEELVDVLLLDRIDRLPVPVLIRVAEALGVVRLLLGLLQVREQQLELVQDALLLPPDRDLASLSCFLRRALDRPLFLPRAQQPKTQRQAHVELLHERVHVARRAQVLEPHEPARALVLRGGVVEELVHLGHRSVHSREDLPLDLDRLHAQHRLDTREVGHARSAQRGQEREGRLATGACLALGGRELLVVALGRDLEEAALVDVLHETHLGPHEQLHGLAEVGQERLQTRHQPHEVAVHFLVVAALLEDGPVYDLGTGRGV